MERLIGFDFGNDSVPSDAGFIKVERLYRAPEYMWVCETKNRWFSTAEASPYRDCLYGRRGEFQMGLPAGEYELRFYFYAPVSAPGPFEVVAGQAEPYAPRLSWTPQVVRTVNVMEGEKQCAALRVAHPGGILAVGFPGEYIINGLEVYGAAGTQLQPIYEEATPRKMPSVLEVQNAPHVDEKEALREICGWLMANRQSDGFVGDYETCGRLWYTASYPLRTLLTGYELFGEQAYLDAATVVLDRFVAEQMPEGSFTQCYRAVPTAQLSAEELDNVRKRNWMNLADVGSAVSALATACHYVQGARLQNYTAAVRKYLDHWALRFQQPEGGFTNGWIRRFDEKVYSVATATTTLTCAVFYEVTGEEKYLVTAEKAALFMADKWHPDGRLWNHVFDTTYPGHDHHQNVEDFGDGFYTLEALLAVLNATKSEKVRTVLFDAIRTYIFGEAGLLALQNGQAWWPLDRNCWHLSKSAGMPMVLCDFVRFADAMGASAKEKQKASAALTLCRQFLTTPRFSGLLGVMCDEPEQEYPFARHSIQCWNGCAAAATGIAGVALAHLWRPGIVFGRRTGLYAR